jgi:hypothetical protein
LGDVVDSAARGVMAWPEIFLVTVMGKLGNDTTRKQQRFFGIGSIFSLMLRI